MKDRILLVESDMRQLIGAQSIIPGFNPFAGDGVCSSQSEAFHELEHNNFDVLLCDIHLGTDHLAGLELSLYAVKRGVTKIGLVGLSKENTAQVNHLFSLLNGLVNVGGVKICAQHGVVHFNTKAMMPIDCLLEGEDVIAMKKWDVVFRELHMEH